ncbi:helix-turn-helix transcriptional regulator [Microvirga tunisiensis]|uniref:Helix-turn-helix transcriptional regulator n=2 Tax=Pannonibacter tanglangensis TaxID=2750084 RepID=A0ABW9ZHG0_9HYPH|nr:MULTISPECIES: helix-turn-helix transcriptional regulator [unclassified Pannonibacter]NBN64287.1 helix-turn-helix transcriptional regulator [Pannonibacter sp. XCT-34]NBN78820.1 helix-turn-helix transcriptional regulator [Pannonibacter sp. XCT-53]
MLSHERVWAAIDALAARKGLSPSGLARRAGLDPTTFNPSKRIASDGRPRWPSTESLAKVLEATGAQLGEFVALVSPVRQEQPVARTVPLTIPFAGFAAASRPGAFDSLGCPHGEGWDEIPFPDAADYPVFALEISGDRQLPVYRDGDLIVVAPKVPIRRGDRVVVRQHDGPLDIRVLHRQTARSIELHPLAPSGNILVLDLAQVDWVARIVWASQ